MDEASGQTVNTINNGCYAFLGVEHDEDCDEVQDLSLLKDFLRCIWKDGYRDPSLKSFVFLDDVVFDDEITDDTASTNSKICNSMVRLGEPWTMRDASTVERLEAEIGKPYMLRDHQLFTQWRREAQEKEMARVAAEIAAAEKAAAKEAAAAEKAAAKEAAAAAREAAVAERAAVREAVAAAKAAAAAEKAALKEAAAACKAAAEATAKAAKGPTRRGRPRKSNAAAVQEAPSSRSTDRSRPLRPPTRRTSLSPPFPRSRGPRASRTSQRAGVVEPFANPEDIGRGSTSATLQDHCADPTTSTRVGRGSSTGSLSIPASEEGVVPRIAAVVQPPSQPARPLPANGVRHSARLRKL